MPLNIQKYWIKYRLKPSLLSYQQNDPDLCAVNKKMADSLVKKGKKVVVVELEKPKTVIPKIELLAV